MKTLLLSSPALTVSTCRYRAGEGHPRHTDPHSRISLVLRGGYREDGRRGSVRMSPGDVLLKSRRAVHEDQFCAEVSVLLALEFLDEDPIEASPQPDLWRKRSDGSALAHAASVLEAALAGDAAAAGAAGADLVSASSSADDTGVRSAPPWLSRLRDELEQCGLASVNVAQRAREAGAHPAHASRLFRQCFGASITDHAQLHCVRRAFAPLADARAPLKEVALAAGFYDQSHMNRVFKRVTGRTPGAHRALLAAIAG